MKTFNVDCELVLHFGLDIEAPDETEAQVKAEEMLEKYVTMLREQPEHYDISIGDIDEAEA